PEDRGAHGRRIRPDPFEDTGAVVKPVGTNMNAGVVPVDELAVHPDLLGLTHAASLLLSKCYVWDSTTSIGRARESRTSSVGDREAIWRSDPAPIQTTRWLRSVGSMNRRSTRGSGNGATAPGSKPVASVTSSGPAIRASRQPAARAILSASALRSPGTRATTGRASQRKTSDFTIWPSSQPTTRAAPWCAAA